MVGGCASPDGLSSCVIGLTQLVNWGKVHPEQILPFFMYWWLTDFPFWEFPCVSWPTMRSGGALCLLHISSIVKSVTLLPLLPEL